MTKAAHNIGRFADVRHAGRVLRGNVLDQMPDGEPKRLRVQTPGEWQGKVLMRGQYELLEWIK